MGLPQGDPHQIGGLISFYVKPYQYETTPAYRTLLAGAAFESFSSRLALCAVARTDGRRDMAACHLNEIREYQAHRALTREGLFEWRQRKASTA
jgi:hypothetical protein